MAPAAASQSERDAVGVEDRDDGDGTEIVDDGERQQEGAQRDGQPAANDGQYGQCEGDVRRHGDAPARQRAVGHRRVHGHEDARRHDHAADRRSRRDHRLADLRERAEDELVLELEPDDEEEHRQQAVGCPDSQREVEVQRDWADLEVHEGEVRVGPRGVGPHQCDCRGDQQQHAADGLVAQALAEVAELEDRRSAQELVGAAHHGAFRLADMRACIADQASRRTRAFGCSLRDLNPPTWRPPARRRSGPSPRDPPGSSRRRGCGSRRRRAGGGA